jgi:hypothetical protein
MRSSKLICDRTLIDERPDILIVDEGRRIEESDHGKGRDIVVVGRYDAIPFVTCETFVDVVQLIVDDSEDLA